MLAILAGDGAIHDRQGEPSDERRAIGGQSRAGSRRRGAIRAGGGRSSVAHEVIRERCEAQRVAHRAIGGQFRANVNSTERSERWTKAKRRSQSNLRAGRNAKGRARSNLGLEHSGRVGRGAIRVQRRVGSEEPGAIQARSGKPSVEHEAIRERGKALKC